MKTTIKVALRNLFRQKKRTVLLAGAIGFGMMMITLMNGLTAGIVLNIRDNFSNALGGHIFVSAQEISDSGQVIYRMRSSPDLEAFLRAYDSDIQTMTRRSQTFGTVIFGSRQVMQLLYGVDFSAEDNLADGLAVVSGDLERVLADGRALILPEPTAQRLGVSVGETVLMRLDTVTGQQNVGEFLVAATIEDQAQFGISAAYSHRGFLNELLNLPAGSFQSLNLFLSDMTKMDAVADDFRQRFGLETAESLLPEMDDESMGFGAMFAEMEPDEPWEGLRWSAITLNQIMEPVEALVQVLDTVSLTIFLILLLIIMVGIMNTFRMILMERTKEIGTMRAFGMQRGTVMRIFLLESLFLSLLGGAFGLGAAAVVMAAASFFRLNVVGLQFFLRQGYITFSLSPERITLYLAMLIAISVAAAFFPARAAAKLSPIEALGSEF